MQERIVRVRDRFDAVEREVEAFVAASSLACPAGCGACCLSPEIEATSVELLPMAQALVDEGRAASVLEALAAAPRSGPCIMYAPDPSDPQRGRCTAYATRPLLCRLFGFGTRRERSGRVELVACRTMRAADPTGVADVAANDVLLALAPVMADHAHALGTDFPGDAAHAVPINDALRSALERELLMRRMRAASEPAVGAGADGDGPWDGGAPEPPLAAA
ncbi:MAG: YkgJ family cysteine cluster protein [Planctomycetota bacterium]